MPLEPAETLAYFTSRYGRALPQPVKRGAPTPPPGCMASVPHSSTTGTRAWRMADVLELAHPKPRDDAQSALFGWLLDRRHERADLRPPADLPVLRANAELQAMAEVERHLLLADPDAGARLAAVGMTWEALSGWLNGPLDRAAWQAVIPSMGYMALLRNLRNFDEAEVSDDVAGTVAAKLADAGQVTRSRQFPFRFVAAYRSAPSLRWGHALERALEVATGNVPAFAGRTLVLIDTSASISNRVFSRRSTMTPFEAAAVFGVTMAKRGKPVDLHGFRRGVRAPGVAGGVGAGRGGAVHRAHRRGRARHPDDGGAARDLPRA
jgi:TROVE domain